MDRLRRSLRDSFRRRKDPVPESSKPHQWQEDEVSVKKGTCSFHVKYLGGVEVFDSRGMNVCEEALKLLRNSRRRPIKAILYVSGDGLRVVEEETKGLIVDQTIEKVSFCAPDRNHEKGFSYICRDGTTRRWMCHGFLALKESGERLSHAVGCAFAACLERKQRRDKECGVTMTFDSKNSTFTRTGSFRQSSITDRIVDPQEIKPHAMEPPPLPPLPPNCIPSKQQQLQQQQQQQQQQQAVHNPFAIERPHATPMMLQRQGSFRGFQQLNQTSPFKRQLSLRLDELPSTLERQRSLSLEASDFKTTANNNNMQVSPIPEASPISDKADPVSAMCQQLSQGLSLLSSNDDPFLSSHPTAQVSTGSITHRPVTPNSSTTNYISQNSNSAHHTSSTEGVAYTNPWAGSITSTASNSRPTQQQPVQGAVPMGWSPDLTSSPLATTTIPATHNLPRPEQWLGSLTSTPNGAVAPPPVAPRRNPHVSHLRSQSLDSSRQFYTPTSTSMVNGGQVPSTSGTTSHQSWGNTNGQSERVDPFDAEWANVGSRNQASTNPFAQNAVKAFEVQM